MHTSIKSALIGLCASVLLLISCSKNNDNRPGNDAGKYYFRAKLNGEQKDFMHSAQFQFGEKDGNLVSATVHGYQSKIDFSLPLEQHPPDFELEIFRYDMKNISPGTYTEAAWSPSTYRLEAEQHIQKKNAQGENYTIQYDEADPNDFTIVFSELSREKGVRGTFKGKIKLDAAPFDVISVTEGEFYFPFNNDLLNP
ncbi:hypothetical protein [Niabella beijingensis]|uniref:hypothetical protein n=1 Tax=Niabella beijingensis TaxID=2872700 RepID=UPI001CBFC372|nr:hypothetical protein [Niabella beijingensis]MBZ4191931.1 hypothetical protein [Niabella beijingensis]